METSLNETRDDSKCHGESYKNQNIPRDLSLLSTLSCTPKSSDEYPELKSFIKTEKSIDDVISYADTAEVKSEIFEPADEVTDDEQNISLTTDFIEDAEELLADLCDVTVDAGRLIKKEVMEGLEVFTKPEDFTADYSWVDGLWGLVSAVTFVIDLASDVFLSSTMNEDPKASYWSLATLYLAVIPLIIQNMFSIYWYWFDERKSKFESQGKTRPAVWLLRLVFHLTLLAPVLRQFDIIYYGIKSTKHSRQPTTFDAIPQGKQCSFKNARKHSKTFVEISGKSALLEQRPKRKRQKTSTYEQNYRKLWLHSEGDSAALDLIGTLLQDAPQMVLQLYVMIETSPSFSVQSQMSHTMMVQLGSVSVSLITMSWTITGFVRAVRLPSLGLRSLSPAEMLLLTLFHFTSIVPQVACFALLASKHLVTCLVFIFIHWLVATIAIFVQFMWLPSTALRQAIFAHDKTNGFLAWVDDIAFSAAIGIAFLVTFVDVDGAAPLLRTILFCIASLAEELIFLTIWIISTSRGSFWHWLPFIIAPAFCGVSLLLSVLYYKMTEKGAAVHSLGKKSLSNETINL